jgi:hypothetical protein
MEECTAFHLTYVEDTRGHHGYLLLSYQYLGTSCEFSISMFHTHRSWLGHFTSSGAEFILQVWEPQMSDFPCHSSSC